MIKHLTCAMGLLALTVASSPARAEGIGASGSADGSAGSSIGAITGLIHPTDVNGDGSASGSFGAVSPLDGYLDLHDVDVPKANAVLRRVAHLDNHLPHGHSILNLPLLNVAGTLTSSIGK